MPLLRRWFRSCQGTRCRTNLSPIVRCACTGCRVPAGLHRKTKGSVSESGGATVVHKLVRCRSHHAGVCLSIRTASRGSARDAGAQTTIVCCELFAFVYRWRDQVAQHDALGPTRVGIQAGPARGNAAAGVFPDEQPDDASRLQKSIDLLLLYRGDRVARSTPQPACHRRRRLLAGCATLCPRASATTNITHRVPVAPLGLTYLCPPPVVPRCPYPQLPSGSCEKSPDGDTNSSMVTHCQATPRRTVCRTESGHHLV